MKLIAHRGNLNGPNDRENQPTYIIESLKEGYDCEIDVRYIGGLFFLGHDNPQYEINISFLLNNSEKLWIHCKNVEALDFLLDYSSLNIFWHQEDSYTITSKGFIWCYPKMKTTNKSIILMPEWNNFEIPKVGYGICSDYVNKLKMC